MSKAKKITSLLLSVVMTFGLIITSFAYLPSDVVNSKYEEAIETLGALEIMIGDAETGNFRPDDKLKRSEFAKIAVEAMGLGEVANSTTNKTKFPDVVENHWANGYITIAAEQGIVIGDDEGNFRPDDSINYAEAMTMLVRITGYEPSATSKGGYPTGYILVGNQNGISKNAVAGTYDAVNRGQIAQMTFNALTVKMMEQVGFGSDATYEVGEKTLLFDTLDVEKLNGQITAVGTSSLTGNSTLKDDQARIGDETFDIAEKALQNVRNLLGFNVVAYVKDLDGTNRTLILARAEKNKNHSLTIDASDLESVEDTTLSYWVDKDNDKNPTEIDIAENAKLIYNGKSVAFNKDLLTPESGSLTLLDQNNDDAYDIIFVTAYENYVVEEVIKTSNRITEKYGKTSLVLDPDDKNITFTITKAGQTIKIDEINEWDVLSVAKSLDGKMINVDVSSNKVTGKITEVHEDTVKVDGNEYDVAANYPYSIEVNDEGTFYLDVSGKIAAVDATSALSSNYAYLMAGELQTGFDKYLEIKIFDKDGATKYLTSGSKIKLNGVSSQTPQQVLTALSNNEGSVVPQLITFETNKEGVLTQVDTATDSKGAVNTDKFTQNASGSYTYKASSKKLGSFNVDADTIVFDIPEGKTDSDDYTITDYKTFEDDASYDVTIFDAEDDLTANVIIVTNSTASANLEAPIAVVDQIVSSTNSNDDVVERIYVYENGERVSYVESESGMFENESGAALKRGDIIQLKTNSKNEVTSIRVLFEAANIATEFEKNIETDLDVVYGKVAKKFVGSVNVTVNDGEVTNYSLSGATVYEFNSAKSSNAIKVVEAGDIAQYDELDPSRVFLSIYKDEVQSVVIVK